jgi:ABC-type multidrug transport system fused ATPase/permease subunit
MVAYILIRLPSDDTCVATLPSACLTDEIDAHRLDGAVLMALQELVARLPQARHRVGERRAPSEASGSVAIARALYHDRQFLILDEATSALDAETERDVVEAVNALQGVRTLLIIAHRESTLRAATRILELEVGGLGIRERARR